MENNNQQTSAQEEVMFRIRLLSLLKREEYVLELLCQDKLQLFKSLKLEQVSLIKQVFMGSTQKQAKAIKQCFARINDESIDSEKHKLTLQRYIDKLITDLVEQTRQNLVFISNSVLDKVFDYQTVVMVLDLIAQTYLEVSTVLKLRRDKAKDQMFENEFHDSIEKA